MITRSIESYFGKEDLFLLECQLVLVRAVFSASHLLKAIINDDMHLQEGPMGQLFYAIWIHAERQAWSAQGLGHTGDSSSLESGLPTGRGSNSETDLCLVYNTVS